jgi:hypothetical protein
MFQATARRSNRENRAGGSSSRRHGDVRLPAEGPLISDEQGQVIDRPRLTADDVAIGR